jgi:hypothetical protein
MATSSPRLIARASLLKRAATAPHNRDYADRYLTIAKSAGLEGHMARAVAMV